MKKIIQLICLFIVALTVNITANAQEKGDMALGGYVVGGTGTGYDQGGIGARFLYNVSNRIRFAAELDSWSETDEFIYVYNTNMYIHFLPSNRNRTVLFYPFVGVGRERTKSQHIIYYEHVSSIKVDRSIAPLYGIGVDIKLSPRFTLNNELRLHQLNVIYGGSLNLALGLMYKFGQ